MFVATLLEQVSNKCTQANSRGAPMGENGQMSLSKKKSSILPPFLNKLGKYPSFETQFSQNRVIKK